MRDYKNVMTHTKPHKIEEIMSGIVRKNAQHPHAGITGLIAL